MKLRPYNRSKPNLFSKTFRGLRPIDPNLLEAILNGKTREEFRAEQQAKKRAELTLEEMCQSAASELGRRK